MRNKIKTEIKNNYVFDAKKFTANLEKIYSEIIEKKLKFLYKFNLTMYY